MWKREEPVKPGTPTTGSGADVLMSPAMVARTEGETTSNRPKGRAVVKTGGSYSEVGKAVIIKGELSGSEDLTIEGKVDGEIELRDHILTVGPNGKIKAQVFAKSVIVMGTLTGNITATDKVNIRENGSVEGDIIAPTVAISEGAQFRGSIDMQSKKRRQGATAGQSPDAPHAKSRSE